MFYMNTTPNTSVYITAASNLCLLVSYSTKSVLLSFVFECFQIVPKCHIQTRIRTDVMLFSGQRIASPKTKQCYTNSFSKTSPLCLPISLSLPITLPPLPAILSIHKTMATFVAPKSGEPWIRAAKRKLDGFPQEPGAPLPPAKKPKDDRFVFNGIEIKDPGKLLLEYMNRNRLLDVYGPSVLMMTGVINYLPAPMPPVSYNFAHALSRFGGVMPALHPIFARENFICSDVAYTELEPALELASSFINEPTMQPFFEAVMDTKRYQDIKSPKFEARFGHRPQIFDVKSLDPKTSMKDAMAIWKTVAQLKDAVEFFIMGDNLCEGRDAEDSYMSTRSWQIEGTGLKSVSVQTSIPPHKRLNCAVTDECNRPKASGSTIIMHQYWIDALQSKGSQAEDFPHYDDQPPDLEAAYMRTILVTAITLCHELTHALRYATRDRKPSKREPFFLHNHVAELGFVFENLLFRGVTEPIPGGVKALACPYGLTTYRFPGGTDVGGAAYKSAYKAGYKHTSHRVVIMRDVHKFFTTDFWQKQAPKHTLEAYKPTRQYGIRVPVPRVLDPALDDSPTVLESPLTPKSPEMKIRALKDLLKYHPEGAAIAALHGLAPPSPATPEAAASPGGSDASEDVDLTQAVADLRDLEHSDSESFHTAFSSPRSTSSHFSVVGSPGSMHSLHSNFSGSSLSRWTVPPADIPLPGDEGVDDIEEEPVVVEEDSDSDSDEVVVDAPEPDLGSDWGDA